MLRPIDRAFFDALGIPRFEAGEEILPPLIHGRPLGPLLAGLELRGLPPQAEQRAAQRPMVAAAIFAGGQFAAMVTRADDAAPWTYGCVFAKQAVEGPGSGAW